MPGSTAPALDRDGASERIRRAAIALFKTRGYHGTPVRELARIVRVEAASLYYHFPSKQEILSEIFDRVMDDLLGGLQRALQSGTSPEERLRAAVQFHVLFHTERQDEAFISHSELRSLTGPNLRRIIAKRDRYQAMLRTLLAEGIKAGVFEMRDVRLMTIAILTLCSGVADWYARRGRLRADTVADAYADMVVGLVRRSKGPTVANLPSRERPAVSTARYSQPRGAHGRRHNHG